MQPGSVEAAANADAIALAQMQPEPSLVGDLLKTAPSAFSRGVTGLLDLPGMVVTGAGGLMTSGLEKTGVISPEIGGVVRETLASLPTGSGSMFREGLKTVTGGASEYQPQTTPGEYLGTTMEFLPGAMVGGLPGMTGRALAYGVVPGLASEAAGQATEGTVIEPYARAAAALASSFLAGRPGAFVGDDEATRMANVMREAGVDLSTGQGTGSQALMRMEGRLQATDKQLADFTAATMRQLGSTAKTALPTNLAVTQNAIVKQMDDALAGVNIIPSQTQSQAAIKVATDYVDRVPAGQLTPRIRGIANEIKALAASGRDVPLSRLKTWRSDIGDFTVSPDAATRNAAHSLRTLIDDMTDQALIAANRGGDIAALAKAREAYRNFIGVRDAATRGASESGILSPTQLNQSMIRAQGRENYAIGRTTPMVDFTRSGAATLRPAPAVSPGGVRSISEALPAALGAAGAGGAIGAGLGPLGAIIGGVGGALAPAVSQMAMRSNQIQAMLRDPLRAMTQIGRTIPGLLAQ